MGERLDSSLHWILKMKRAEPECVIPLVILTLASIPFALDYTKPWIMGIPILIYPSFRAIQVFLAAFTGIIQGRYISVSIDEE